MSASVAASRRRPCADSAGRIPQAGPPLLASRRASHLSPAPLPVSPDVDWQRTPAAAGRYRAWLTDRGSLTARIAARCPGVRVEVTFQGLRRPDRDERFLFADGGRSRVLVREVLLCCGDTPVVFAHTVVRPRDLRGAVAQRCAASARARSARRSSPIRASSAFRSASARSACTTSCTAACVPCCP